MTRSRRTPTSSPRAATPLLITRLIRRVNSEFGIRVPVREMLTRRTLNGHIAVVRRIRDEHVENATGS
ncbi:acyl carrier protein [Streptomyces tricolor]|nr:acyl carrier protein [Streptomyces tricolor]